MMQPTSSLRYRLAEATIDQKDMDDLADAMLALFTDDQLYQRYRDKSLELVQSRGARIGLELRMRERLRKRGMWPCIPERRGRRPRPGRKPDDLTGYRQRWHVERAFTWFGNSDL